VWKELPSITFWIGPTLIGIPIVARALRRHTSVRRDLRELLHLRRGPVANGTRVRSAAERGL
jgi:hypothetical protein